MKLLDSLLAFGFGINFGFGFGALGVFRFQASTISTPRRYSAASRGSRRGTFSVKMMFSSGEMLAFANKVRKACYKATRS